MDTVRPRRKAPLAPTSPANPQAYHPFFHPLLVYLAYFVVTPSFLRSLLLKSPPYTRELRTNCLNPLALAALFSAILEQNF